MCKTTDYFRDNSDFIRGVMLGAGLSVEQLSYISISGDIKLHELLVEDFNKYAGPERALDSMRPFAEWRTVTDMLKIRGCSDYNKVAIEIAKACKVPYAQGAFRWARVDEKTLELRGAIRGYLVEELKDSSVTVKEATKRAIQRASKS